MIKTGPGTAFAMPSPPAQEAPHLALPRCSLCNDHPIKGIAVVHRELPGRVVVGSDGKLGKRGTRRLSDIRGRAFEPTDGHFDLDFPDVRWGEEDLALRIHLLLLWLLWRAG